MLFYFIDMKVCTKCKEEKELSEFGKEKENKDGLKGSCKSCIAIYQTSHHRTKEGKLKRVYSNQLKSSKERGHNPPTYTKQQFIDRFINDKKYLLLHSKWVASDYDKMLSPSFDRLDDYKGYSFDNIQIITWQENDAKGRLDIIEGRNNKVSKAVIGTNIKTGNTIEFFSSKEAFRNGFNQGAVSACCLGKRNKHKGYKWSYK